jgi:hypothetical protein
VKASIAAAVMLAGGLLVGTPQENHDPLRLDHYTRCYANEMKLRPWRVAYALLKESPSPTLMARTYADASRYQAFIVYNFPVLKQRSDTSVRRTVVHELAHVLTAELKNLAALQDTVMANLVVEQLVTRVELWDVWLGLCP